MARGWKRSSPSRRLSCAGRRYPTLLHIHGGPVDQFAYGYDFERQYLAASGYVVVQPNPRGSTGRGQDFVRGIYRNWGITDYDDVIGAVDHVIGMGIADPDRLGVLGYSYGGYMTNVVITRTNRFKAAASGAGHSLIVANYGHDIYQQWYNWETRAAVGEPRRIRPTLATAARGQRPDADDISRRPRGLERAHPERRAVLPVVAEARHRHPARGLSRHAPRRLDGRVRKDFLCASAIGSTSTLANGAR